MFADSICHGESHQNSYWIVGLSFLQRTMCADEVSRRIALSVGEIVLACILQLEEKEVDC